MRDFSFLRLEPTLAKALDIYTSPVVDLYILDQIQLSPKEVYCQITNTSSGIAFNGNFEVWLIDTCGNEITEITSKVAVREFQDEQGLPQIAFELAYLSEDFYMMPICLKFVHTVSEARWYSNPFILSEYQINETTRIDYRNYFVLQGISPRPEVSQSIRLRCYFDRTEDDIETKQYYQLSTQNQISSQPLWKRGEVYKFEYIDRFTSDRLKVALMSDLVFVDGVRVTDKPAVSDGERYGDTNAYESEFKCCKDYKELFQFGLQLFEPFEIINRLPEGAYSTLPANLEIEFNRAFTLGSGTVNIHILPSENIVATFNPDNFTITGNTATVTLPTLSNGDYFVEFFEGFFISEFDETLQDKWFFSLGDSEYDSDDYNNEYLI
jgi:hypothetical protein